MRDNVSYAYAGFGVRFCAWLVDSALTLIPLSIVRGLRSTVALAEPDSILTRAVFFRYSFFDLLLMLVPVLYFIVLTYANGATFGKMMFKLKVVHADGERLTLWTLIVRELFGRYLSTATFLIGYLIAIPDQQKRTLHDRLAYTRVVYNVVPTPVRAATPPPPAPTEAQPEFVRPVDPPTPVYTAPVDPPKPVEPPTPVYTAPVENATPVEPPTPVYTAPVDPPKPVEPAPVENATPVNLEKPHEP